MNRPNHRTPLALFTLVAGLLVLTEVTIAQDSNIMRPVSEIENLLSTEDFQVLRMPGSRFEGDRTQSATLQFGESTMLQAQWAAAPRGGGEFNNRPRLEVAAYEVQKIFLDEPDYVVPPTVLRSVPMTEYPPQSDASMPVEATWDEWNMVLVVLQYWLWNVSGDVDTEKLLDKKRFENEPAYAKHMANLNLFTYLIRHRDSNVGNFVVSADPANPRMFSIDNGIAFSGGEESNRGTYWERIRVEAFPRQSIDRLRAVTEEQLHESLGVLAQFEVGPDGKLHPVEPTANLDPGDGIRRTDAVLQLGLRDSEIRRLYGRIQDLLEDVDKGDYDLF